MNIRTDIRPATFKQMVGESEDVKALEAHVEAWGVPHTVLFHGPSGCGKTTLARILAGQLQGAVDLVERNVADLNGVEDARALAQMSVIRPLAGSRVFILDECQRLSKDAQDVLLKPAEEPADWCYWFFGTTDPGKISKTLQSRARHVRVEELRTAGEVLVLVQRALRHLNSDADPKAVGKQIWEAGIRAPRFILSSVEAIVEGGKPITGEASSIAAFDAARAYFKDDLRTVAAYFKEASATDIVSWQFVAANYGASILKNGSNKAAQQKVLRITSGYPEESVLRAAWLVAQVLG